MMAEDEAINVRVYHHDAVEVLDGLSAGDLVVTAGQQRIRKDGTEVRVVELGKQGNGGTAAPAARPASAKKQRNASRWSLKTKSRRMR